MFAISLEELEKRTHLNNITKSNSVMIEDERRTGGSEEKGLGLLNTFYYPNATEKFLQYQYIQYFLAPSGAQGVTLCVHLSVCVSVALNLYLSHIGLSQVCLR